MKRKLLLISACFAFLLSHSQNAIPNAGFENWNNNPNYDDPAGWGTINGLTYFLGVKTVTKTTDKHSGSFAIKLESKTVPLQGVAPGIAATGTINPSTQAVDGGVVFTQRPSAITGWYKYIPSGVDTGSVEAILWRWNAGTREEVGIAEFTVSNTVNAYSQLTANFNYSSPAAPDSLVITILTSSGANNSPNGTQMFVDDLAFDFSSSVDEVAGESIHIYPNPAIDVITVELSNSAEFIFSVFDLEGKLVVEKILKESPVTIDIKSLPEGLYSYMLKNNLTRNTVSSKFLINR